MALSTSAPSEQRERKSRTSPSAIPTIVPMPGLLERKARSEKAIAYDDKVQGVLSMVMRMLASSESTVSDAATFIEHGEAFASKMGDLAARDKRVAHGIDLITSGSENPYVAVVLAALPIVAQITRNHETDTARPFEIRIPFTKRTIKPKIKIKLNIAFMRALTVHPRTLIQNVFSRPEVREALIEQGVEVALPEYRNVNATSN